MRQFYYSLLLILLMYQSSFGLITITDKQLELADAIKNPTTKIIRFIDLIDTTELNQPCTKNGRYPVHLVAMRKKPLYTQAMMYLLYKKGANTDINDRENKTPLTYAIKNNNTRLIELLLRFRSKNVSLQTEIVPNLEKDAADEYCKKYSDSSKRSQKKRAKLQLNGKFRKLTL